jgi:hypothetical protein
MQNKTPSPAPRKTWRKPVLVEHGDLVTLTRGKTPGGTDSGLGTPS